MDRSKYGIEVMRPVELERGDLYWRVLSIRHLPVGENGNKHHIFVNVYGLNGEELRNSQDVKIFWGWDGQQADEFSPPISLDKPANEDMANIPMEWGQHIFVSVTSKDAYFREIARNLHTAHPDEGPDVRTGHHSFQVNFQLTEYQGGEGGDSRKSIKERLNIIIADLEDILSEL